MRNPLLEAIDLFTQEYVIPITTDRQTADRDKVIVGLFYRSLGFVKSAIALTSVVQGMSRALLKLSGSLVHDYATISDDSPSPNRASRARRAATSAGIS